ncbi:hypothetical protein [Glycomyces sp. MUSA5-2]
MSLDGVWTIPGWGLAFAMWALAAVAGAVIVAATALVAWRGRKRRR